MNQIASCNLCEINPFAVPMPLDPIGVTLMQPHLEREHDVRPRNAPTQRPLPREQWSERPDQEGWWY